MLTCLRWSRRSNIVIAIPILLVANLGSIWPSEQSKVGIAQSNSHIFPIGKYALGGRADTMSGLTEFSATEYSYMPKQFVGEANYNAPPATFLGRPWSMSLGTVNGRIYKIAASAELTSKTEANEAASVVFKYCSERLGKPIEQKNGITIWDTPDGNVILQTAEAAGMFAVNLFLTSREVRNFRRK